MRIIAGEWRGRVIDAPSGSATRPTAERARETLFSMLTSRLGSFEGLEVADLFAGSGALGLEALSRGAVFALFVENDAGAVKTIHDNIQRVGAGDRARVIGGSALTLRPSQRFPLVIADPPYALGGASVVEAVLVGRWLAPGGWLSLETKRGEVVGADGLAIDAVRDLGAARLTLLRSRETA